MAAARPAAVVNLLENSLKQLMRLLAVLKVLKRLLAKLQLLILAQAELGFVFTKAGLVPTRLLQQKQSSQAD